MLTVTEAFAAILQETSRLETAQVKLADALGLVLATDAVCDLDSPPFDKALMDGYAVRAGDCQGAEARLRVIDEVPAGQVSRLAIGPGEAIRIMTGAPIPEGADAVVQVERTRCETHNDRQTVVIAEPAGVVPGKSILRRGESTRQGTCVVPAGRKLRAQELGALAELGQADVAVYRAPRVAVLATGDELVPVDQVPGPGQIRNSNETMLVAQLRQMGAIPVPLGVARDQAADLREKIEQGLSCDLLLLSGGVSAGKFDLVPSVLAAAGVREVFHRVRLKPGQPIWFGVRARSRVRVERGPGSDPPHSGECGYSEASPGILGAPDNGPCHVFGLPGNPVSSMVCCELFVRTAVRRLMGTEPATPQPLQGRLGREHFNAGNRPTYHPARWEWTEQGGRVETVKWVGSADLCATVGANALAVFADGDRLYPADSLIDVLLWLCPLGFIFSQPLLIPN
jgi:molybdopterin molybdotransferase